MSQAPERAGDTRTRRRWLLRLLFLLVVSIVTVRTYRPVLGLGLLGWDAYPMILASRVSSSADLLGTFTEELMDGLYTDGHFYRPLTSASFSCDYALWGLEPRGYHRTDLAILALSAVALGGLVRRLFGKSGHLAGWIAALVFVLHPAQIELIPVPARRADLLCSFFIVVSLLLACRHRRPAVASFVVALAAAASKETGVLVVPLVFALRALRSPRSGLAERLRGALTDSLPALGAVALYCAARSTVVSGLGGHEQSSLANLSTLPGIVLPYLALVLYPQPFLAGKALSTAWVLGAAGALVGYALVLSRPAAGSEPGVREATRAGLVFLAIWWVALLVMSAVAGRIHDWYAVLFVAPYAALVGLLLERGVRALRTPPGPAAIGLTLVPGVLLTSQLCYSSLFHTYDDWWFADELSGEFLRRFERNVGAARAGDVIVVEGLVPVLPARADGSGVRSVALLTDYSLEAYAELALDGPPVSVAYDTGAVGQEASPGEILVLVIPRAPPPR